MNRLSWKSPTRSSFGSHTLNVLREVGNDDVNVGRNLVGEGRTKLDSRDSPMLRRVVSHSGLTKVERDASDNAIGAVNANVDVKWCVTNW